MYTRIDLLLVDQGFLESLSSVSIGSIRISDYTPISISLAPPSPDTRWWAWRLNKNMLDDAVTQKQVSDTISLYFKKNMTGETGMASVWEGHKAVVWGELIAQGSRLKKELQSLLAQL